ncbi:GNAT family N-acetyltransferase [Halioxenophilus sp. WMMB6]|uniref:GNAT family N-acetyltransferase n=1 Tax=Halioxenophilus sp. WMMB6 TaxID=3073815 RepID=UPI00295EE583|nr:GNAT family N-acetyltransferase [Halioxenophilus sp. WMMB6]
MEYRAANEADAEKMVEIHYRSVLAIPTEFYSSNVKAAWSPVPGKDRVDWLANVIVNPDFICTVAVDRSKGVVGFSIFNIPDSFLRALYIDPEFNGQGIGSALLSQVDQDAKRIELQSIALKSSLNAETFYLKSGYSKVCDSTQELSNGSVMQAKAMKKNLHNSA